MSNFPAILKGYRDVAHSITREYRRLDWDKDLVIVKCFGLNGGLFHYRLALITKSLSLERIPHLKEQPDAETSLRDMIRRKVDVRYVLFSRHHVYPGIIHILLNQYPTFAFDRRTFTVRDPRVTLTTDFRWYLVVDEAHRSLALPSDSSEAEALMKMLLKNGALTPKQAQLDVRR